MRLVSLHRYTGMNNTPHRRNDISRYTVESDGVAQGMRILAGHQLPQMMGNNVREKQPWDSDEGIDCETPRI